jgi:hypothetical protein
MSYEQRDNGRNNFREEDGSNTQLFIAKGRNDGMDSRSLVDFISDETGTDSSLISNVKVLDAFSFFAVPNDEAGKILDYFQEKAGEEGRPLVSKAKRKNSSGGGGGGFDRNRPRNYDDRPRRDYDDRPRRDYNDRPRRDYDDRPRRDYGDGNRNGNNG